MKTLSKLAFVAAVMLTAAVCAQAGMVRGHFRSNGTYVNSYYRTPANGTPYDNLSYRGYPSQQQGYVSPRSYGFGSSRSRSSFNAGNDFGFSSRSYSSPRTLPAFDSDCLVRPLHRSGYSF